MVCGIELARKEF